MLSKSEIKFLDDVRHYGERLLRFNKVEEENTINETTTELNSIFIYKYRDSQYNEMKVAIEMDKGEYVSYYIQEIK